MRKTAFLLLAILFKVQISFGQLSGTKNIPGDYATIAIAVSTLNSQGVGAGGVIFNVAAGHIEISDIPVINATGTAAATITFQKAGPGSNPKIMRLTAGTINNIGLGGNGDAIIIINGGDYINFDGIDLQTDSTFTGAGMMEYGYFLKKNSGTNACKNVVIKNCSITLNKAAINSFGIYVSNISGTTNVTVTSNGGRSENIKIYNDSISNVYGGIQLKGYAAAAPYTLYDQNIEIGQDSANHIFNFGGGATDVYVIFAMYQNELKINNNSIIGGTGTTLSVYGIEIYLCNNSNLEINNNYISLSTNATSSSCTLTGISIEAGGTAGNSSIQNVINNTIENFSSLGVGDISIAFIYSRTNYPYNLNIKRNKIGNSNLVGTNHINLIEVQSISASALVDSNVLSNVTATQQVYGIYTSGGSPSTLGAITISNNNINNISTSGAVGGMYISYHSFNIFKNKIYNLTSFFASPFVEGLWIDASCPSLDIYNNLIADLKAPNSTTSVNFPKNTVMGIFMNDVTSPPVTGPINISYNTIYLNAVSSGNNFSTSCIFHNASSNATEGSLTLRNNILLNYSSPGLTGRTSVFSRNSVATANYNSSSNNNLFYAGTPASNRVIFYDGTNSDQTLVAYKTRMFPRDSSTITENMVSKFFSTSGSSPYFLHIDPFQSPLAANAGINISGITKDYDEDTRSSTTPDIGADEFAIGPINIFVGSGNFNDPANWSNNIVPPSPLPPGQQILINGNCTLNIPYTISGGSNITVMPGVTFLIQGNLTILK